MCVSLFALLNIVFSLFKESEIREDMEETSSRTVEDQEDKDHLDEQNMRYVCLCKGRPTDFVVCACVCAGTVMTMAAWMLATNQAVAATN